MAGDIVLGYDGSEGARAALPHAVALARAFDVPLAIVFAFGQNPVGGVTGDVRRAVEETGESMLEGARAAALAVDPTVDVQAELVDGRPVDALVAVADQRSARMLVVGGNGHGSIVGSLLGSSTYKVLPATVPVLVVQPPRTIAHSRTLPGHGPGHQQARRSPSGRDQSIPIIAIIDPFSIGRR
jgi:nucleotide-binding universal stress UspA family protein